MLDSSPKAMLRSRCSLVLLLDSLELNPLLLNSSPNNPSYNLQATTHYFNPTLLNNSYPNSLFSYSPKLLQSKHAKLQTPNDNIYFQSQNLPTIIFCMFSPNSSTQQLLTTQCINTRSRSKRASLSKL